MKTTPSDESKYALFEAKKDIGLDILLELTRDAVRRVRKAELDQYNIHPRRYALLLVLKEMETAPTPAELSRRLLRERHSVSELLNKMEKDGLIKKRNDTERKNSIRVFLSAKGRKLCDQASKRDSIHKVFSTLNKTRLKQTKSLMEKLRDAILAKSQTERSVPHLHLDDLDYIVYLLLLETTDEIIKLKKQELNQYGMHYRRATLILLIKEISERATAVEIADHLCRQRNSVSELLTKMESDGLVEKVNDKIKGNIVRFVLTSQGTEAYHQIVKREPNKKIIEVLTRQQRQSLKSNLLAIYHKALEVQGV